MLYNSTNILCSETLGLSVIDGVYFIDEEAKDYVYRYLEIMGEYINPVFHAWVIIKRVAVKVAKFKCIPL